MPPSIVVLCTANQCRSPMGEALLRRRLAERRVDAEVSSAGLMDGGAPPTGRAIDAMAAVGLDISDHLSVQVSPELIGDAALIITMTRQHLVELTLMAPQAWTHMFQIRDLLNRAEAVGPRSADAPFSDWVAAVGDGRSRSDILAGRLRDDVADPVGHSAAVFERTRRELDDLMTRLALLL